MNVKLNDGHDVVQFLQQDFFKVFVGTQGGSHALVHWVATS